MTRTRTTRGLLGLCLALLIPCHAGAAPVAASGAVSIASEVPAVPREMRGLWVATVGNMDWPSKKGLTTDQQKAELLAILDKAQALGMNAVILQVRPAADALYASDLEPWSEYLTGTMGKAPEPYYDPLAFAVEEAHKRGLQLHAWFNPFRARYSGSQSSLDPRHIAARRPDLVKAYGRYLWMDPGEPQARQHSLDVILDVVRRYDIDGVHLDDYFYPYKVADANKQPVDFPDDASYAKYRASGGTLQRADWRRSNINAFVQALYAGVKKAKPWVLVGISPFGIWRPGNPSVIQGLDPYEDLYADSRLWLQNGWVDYFTPQLYWATSRPHQSYPVLLDWWAAQNVKARHLWPGNILSLGPDEIAQQIGLTRRQSAATGNILFNADSVMQDRKGIDAALASAYAEPALVPASPWLDDVPPPGPSVKLMQRVETGGSGDTSIAWVPGGGEHPSQWVVQVRRAGVWDLRLLPGSARALDLGGASTLAPGDVVALSAVDRTGNQSLPTVLSVDAPGDAGKENP